MDMRNIGEFEILILILFVIGISTIVGGIVGSIAKKNNQNYLQFFLLGTFVAFILIAITLMIAFMCFILTKAAL